MMKKRDIRKLQKQIDRQEVMEILMSSVSPLQPYELATLIAAKDVKEFKKKLKKYARKYDI